MKCQEVGAEGLCSDASHSHRRGGSGCLWEAALIPEQEKRGHLRHCWKVNQSLGSFLLCWLLEGSPAQPEANFNTSSLCHSSGSSPCKQPRCAKGPPDSKCHTSVQAATLPTSGICFFQFTEHQLVSPCSGAAFRGAQRCRKTWTRQPWLLLGTRCCPGNGRTSLLSMVSVHHLAEQPQRATALSNFLSSHKSFAINNVAHKAFLYCIIKQLLPSHRSSPEAASSTTLPLSSVWAEGPLFCTIPLKRTRIKTRLEHIST